MGYVTLVQEYQNEGKEPIEGVYTFPGSTRSAVHHSTVTIGDEVIEAKIQKREEAARQYSAALTQGKTALLKIAEYDDDRCAEAVDPLIPLINGSFGALMMIGSLVTSLILAVVASTASTRRHRWVIASIIFATLAVGSFVLRSLVTTWFNDTPAGF
jgi:hypothetical protein